MGVRIAIFFSISLPIEGVARTGNADFYAHGLQNVEPACGEYPDSPSVSNRVRRNVQRGANCVSAERGSNMTNCGLIHAPNNAKLFSISQANNALLRQINWQSTIHDMQQDKPRPYSDIAERIKWHREIVLDGMRQQDYADSIGVKRSALSLWEAGTHRLSLDGALALRTKYGLSLDFMYEGIDDALPMTLRNAWRVRP